MQLRQSCMGDFVNGGVKTAALLTSRFRSLLIQPNAGGPQWHPKSVYLFASMRLLFCTNTSDVGQRCWSLEPPSLRTATSVLRYSPADNDDRGIVTIFVSWQFLDPTVSRALSGFRRPSTINKASPSHTTPLKWNLPWEIKGLQHCLPWRSDTLVTDVGVFWPGP